MASLLESARRTREEEDNKKRESGSLLSHAIAQRQTEIDRYNAAMQKAESGGRTKLRTQVMMQGFHNDPFKQAESELSVQGNYAARNTDYYNTAAKSAYNIGDYDRYMAAMKGLQGTAANYAGAQMNYLKTKQKAREKQLDDLKKTDKGAYYAETLSKDQIEGQLRVINRQLQNIEAMRQGAASTDYAYDVTVKSDSRMQELEQQKAMYESALRQRTAIDKKAEMQELANSVTGRSDYDRLVRAGREIVSTKNNNARAYGYQYSPDDPDDNRQFARAEQLNREAMKAAGYVDDLDSSYIPEEVKPVYYALYASDPAKAKEWADYWRAIGEDQYWAEIYQQSGADTGSRLKAFIEGTWANTAAGLDPFGEGGQYAAKLGSTMIGGGAAGLTEKGLFNTGFGAGTYHSDLFGDLSLGSAYQLGSSMLQSGANATLAKLTGGLAGFTGGMGTILLGSSAAAQDYQQKIDEGWDEGSAKLHALAAGAAESIFEYVSLDKLVNEDVTRGFIRNFLTQGGVEASEEAFTTIANRITDAAISELNGYDNQIQSKAKELMSKGYEKGAAEKMAEREWFTELMSDALGGFVSGGIMSSGQYAMQPIYRAAGAVSEFNDFTRTLSDTGEQSIDSTKDLTKGRVGRLMGRVGANLSTEQIEAARQITGQQGETAENQSKRQQKKQSTRDGAVYEQAVQSIQQQIEQRGVGTVSEVYNETVQKYGEAAKEIAQEAIYRSTGQTMSQATDMAELERSANSMAKDAAPEVFQAVQKAKDQRAFDLYRQSGNTEDAERMMQQRAGNQSHGGALNMEAVITRNGAEQKASITGLSKDGKGVVLSDGSTVTAREFASKDFAADADTKDIVGFLLKSDMGPAAELALQNYIIQAKAGRATDGYRYVMDTALAFNQGRRGAISVEQAQQRSSLDAETVSRFFALGEETRKSDTAKEQAHVDELLANAAKGVTGRKGSVDTSKVNRKLSDAESKNLEVATKLAEVLGVDLGIFVSETDAKGRFVGENGRYQDGKIWIDINAGRNSVEDIGSGILACMSHELTHFIQDYAPKAYEELKQFVLRQLTEAKGSAWVDRQIQSKIRRSKGQQLSITAAEDEVVADACQNVLTDSKAIHEYAKRFPQSFAEVLEWIKDFFAKVKEALSSRPMSTEAQVMSQLEAKVRKAFGELWDKGVMEAAEVHGKVGSKQSGTQQQYSVRPAQDLYQTEFDFTEPMTTDEFRKLIKQENDASKYFPKGLSDDFMKAITKKFFFTRPKLYRGIDASEFDFIAKNGYIKSNSSYNFDDQKDQTFSDEDAGYALSYATGFAPSDISKRHYEDGQPSYLIEFINSPDLNMSKNGVQESSTYGNIDQKFITRIFEIMYDPETDNDMIQDVTNDKSIRSMFPQLGKGLEGLSHGRPMFYRDKTTGTILYAVQGPDGWENGEYISEKFPGAILNYDRAESNNTMRFFGVSGNKADLEPMKVGKDGKLVPAKNVDILYSERSNIDTMTEDQLRDDLQETEKTFREARKQYQSIGDTEEHKKLLDAMVSNDKEAIKRYAEWAQSSGYEDAYQRMTEAQKRMEKGRKRLDQLIDERMEAEESKAIEKSGLSEAEYFRKQAVKTFGYTPYFYDAGYILPNGKLLNFSGEKGRHFGSRGQDHRAIGQIYANSTGSAAMTRFMNDGNVRIMAESPGLDVSGTTPLTSEQYSTIRKFVNQVRGEEYFNLDFSDERGNTIDSIEYEGRINAERVVNDIKHFFETGEARHPSGLSAFYSLRSSPLEGQIGLFGEDGSIQTEMFGAEAQEGEQTGLFEEKPKSGGELFLDSLRDFLEKKKANHNVWYGKEFDAFYEEHPELNFVKRFMDNDPKGKADLQAFAASIDDEKVLSDLSWYTTQSPSISKKPGYRGALTKVRNVYKNRISEIAAEKNNGRVYKLERKAYDAKEIRRIFDELNTNKAMSKLADKVFDTTRSLGLQFYATNRILGKQQALVGGTNAGKNIWLRINTFADKGLSDQYKASVILHEMIHACTNYAFSSDYKRSPYQNERIINAVNAMEAIYQQAKYEKSLQGEYGLKEIREFTAELANPEFREKLEKVSLLERAINAIKRFFGIEKTNALDSASTALDYLLDNLDTEGFREYSSKVERDIEHWERQNGMARFSERDYDMPSDLELMDAAAESLSEAGGEEYWKALLESVPELADQREELKSLMQANREQAKKLQKAEKQLADAERQMTLTNRAVNTKGVNEMVLGVMKDLAAGDAKGKHVAKRVREILINAYQKALDMIDKGANTGTALETVYNDGVVPAAELLGSEATHSEKIGYKWTVGTLASYAGQDTILEYLSAAVGADFAANRYRAPIRATAADSIAERVKRPMQKKLDEAREKNRALTTQNERLSSDLDELKRHWQSSAEQVTTLNELLQDTRQELKEGKRLSEKERRAKLKRIESLSAQIKAKRAEAKAWKELAERNESVLRAALASKNADIDELRMQMNKNATEAQKKQTALVKKLKDQVEREKKILEGTLKPPAMQTLLQAVREEARKNAEQHKDEVFARYKERKNQTSIRNRIKNLNAEMQRDLLRPREGHFVPEALVRPVVELLDMVNTQTKRAKSESAQARIDAINAQYDKLKADERYSQYYDETVKAMLVELSSTLEGRSIYALSADELSDVYTAMKAMRTIIRNAIRADLVEKGKQIWEVGNELRQELRNSRGASPYLIEKYHMAMLSGKRAFNRFGGYRQNSTWNKVYKMLDDAQLKMLNLEMQATRIFDPVLKAKEDFEKAQALTSIKEKDLVDVGLKDADGNAVKITRGMMLGLYMQLQNEENMRHIMYGGMTLPDFKRYYKGSDEAWGRGTVEIPALGVKVSNLDALLEEYGEEYVDEKYQEYEDEIRELFESVRGSIEEQLTDYDRKWIAASKEFFDNFSRQELNAVTNAMYGFSKARVDNYFPIVTDANFLKSEFDSISRNISLENAGFMKERVKARNPILLEDITRTVNRQISNVSQYAGLTQALKQFGNIYNVQAKGFTDSVKKAMAKSYGKNGQEYIQNLITDMIGGRATPGSIFDRIKGNYAQAVLSANFSVTIKQAASFPTAAATVGWSPIMKALVKGGKNGRLISRADRALIDTYSPLLWKRSQGAIDTEIGDMAHAQDWTKKAKWLMGWIEKTDIATVGRLWYAAEYYVQDNFNLEKGSEEQIRNGESPFYQKVAEVFTDIVEDTQPNYTVLQRPDILRNPNKLVRAMTMFSTQRFQNANILIDAAGEYEAMRRADKKNGTEESKAARAAAKKKLTWAISSQVVSAVVLNVMTLVGAALLHRMNPWRDDDDEITVSSVAGEYMNGFLSTMAGSFLGGSELYEAISSLLTGSKYYGNDVGGISTINEFATAFVEFGQKAVKLIGDENSKPEDWTKLAEKQLAKVGEYLAQMTGIPAANINKIIAGGKNHIIDIIKGEFGSFEAGVERSAKVNANRYVEALEAGDSEKVDLVEAEMLQNYADGGKDEDEAAKAMKTKLTSTLKEKYETGSIEAEDAVDLLVETGFYNENDAWKKVKEWTVKAEHAGEKGYSYSQYSEMYELMDQNGDIKTVVKDLEDHGVDPDSVKSAAKGHLIDRYMDGQINSTKIKNQLSRYCGIVGKDAEALVRWLDLRKANPGLEVTQAQCSSWYDGSSKSRENGRESARAAGMSIEAYLEAKAVLDQIKDQNGNRTGEDEVIEALSRMNLPARQKDALYYERYKGTSKHANKLW